MHETRRLTLRYREALACEIVAVLRNHHDTMPGPTRDRSGMDRLRVRLLDGAEVTVDVWSHGEQDVATAPLMVELYDRGDLVRWQPPADSPQVAAPSDEVSLPLTG